MFKSTPLIYNFFLIISLIGYTISDSTNDKQPVIRTLNGAMQGITLNFNGIKGKIKQVDAFLGIPYAKPPIGELRLEKPQPTTNWTGVFKATKLGSPCVPIHFLGAPDFSEDCLFLNVLRPAGLEKNTKLSVLVFIHGGGYNLGGNFVEGYYNISRNFVTQNIIVVTIQYRLGFFGFFSDGTSELPGNYGLWDQRQALLWIQENINAFGGDRKRVTVWGQSAGSASVSMLTISRHTRDLFAQAIEQSGSIMSRWAFNEETIKFSKSLIPELSCLPTDSGFELNNDSDEDSTEKFEFNSLKECIKNLTREDVLFALGSRDVVRGTLEFVVFNPRFDNDFFDTDIDVAMQESPKKPSLFGFNSHEAAFLTLSYCGSIYGFRGPMSVEEVETFMKSNLTEFINKIVHPTNLISTIDIPANNSIIQSDNHFSEKSESLQNIVTQFYVDKKKAKNEDFRYFMEQYTLFLSDVMFIVPILWEVIQKAQNGWPTYVYQFDYANPEMFKKFPFNAVNHGTEYPYLQGVHIFRTFEFNEEDKRVHRTLVDIYSNFVKTGNPSTKKIVWSEALATSTPIQSQKLKALRFVSSSPQVEFLSDTVNRRFQFWDKLKSTYDLNKIFYLPTVKRH